MTVLRGDLPAALDLAAERLASGGLVPMGTEDGGTTQSVLLPLLMGGRRLNVRQPIAAIGEHTDEVLAALRTTV